MEHATTQELCPFCSLPITREYGSFRCKHCARTSEDVIDLERRTRLAETRKAARAANAPPPLAAPKGKAAKLRAVALAVARHAERKKAARKTGGGARG